MYRIHWLTIYFIYLDYLFFYKRIPNTVLYVVQFNLTLNKTVQKYCSSQFFYLTDDAIISFI